MQINTDNMPLVFRRLQALAERNPQRAIGLFRRRLALLRADDPIIHAWTVYTLGWGLLFWERFDEARSHFRTAREVFAAHLHRCATLYCDYALLLADLFQHARTKELALVSFTGVYCTVITGNPGSPPLLMTQGSGRIEHPLPQ